MTVLFWCLVNCSKALVLFVLYTIWQFCVTFNYYYGKWDWRSIKAVPFFRFWHLFYVDMLCIWTFCYFVDNCRLSGKIVPDMSTKKFLNDNTFALWVINVQNISLKTEKMTEITLLIHSWPISFWNWDSEVVVLAMYCFEYSFLGQV